MTAPIYEQSTFSLDRIRVGERHRRDMGDLGLLAASMNSDLGLLQPIGVRPDGTLIWGERRLLAAKLLGWTHIQVRVVDLDDIARGEYAENTLRKDFTLSEAVAIKRALEPIERAAAQERMRAGKPSEKFSEGGNALDKIAKATGVTARRWPRPRPSLMPPRPSRRSSASCSKTWTAPAVSMASFDG